MPAINISVHFAEPTAWIPTHRGNAAPPAVFWHLQAVMVKSLLAAAEAAAAAAARMEFILVAAPPPLSVFVLKLDCQMHHHQLSAIRFTMILQHASEPLLICGPCHPPLPNTAPDRGSY